MLGRPVTDELSIVTLFLVGVGFYGFCRLLYTGLDSRGAADPVLVPVVLCLTGLGLVFVARLAPDLLLRQVMAVGLGGMGMLILARTSINQWEPHGKVALLIGGLLLLAPLGLGSIIGGAQRWVQWGAWSLQPSEMAKICLVIALAAALSRPMQTGLTGNSGRWFSGALGMGLVYALLLLLQRDVGYAVIFLVVTWGMVFFAAGSLRPVLAWGSVSVVALAGAVTAFPHARLRVGSWLDPWLDPTGAGFQLLASLRAWTRGDLLGTGLGLGMGTSVPSMHTDLVMTAVGEELGLAGAIGLVCLYLILTARGLAIAACQPRGFAAMLAIGITLFLGVQTIFVVGGATGALPLSGMVLPFMGYGGTAAVGHLLMVGLLCNLAARGQRVEPASHPSLFGPRLGATARGPYSIGLQKRLMVAFVIITTLFVGQLGWMAYWQTATARDADRAGAPGMGSLAARGGIYDRRGEPLAVTETVAGRSQRAYFGPASLGATVGYVHPRLGRAGLESAFHHVLTGRPETGPRAWLADPLDKGAPAGDLWLSVDRDVQQTAEEALVGRSGAVVVLDPRTGAVLALASSPGFNPELVGDAWTGLQAQPGGPLLNRATQGLYPPGSTFKVAVLAAALTEASQAGIHGGLTRDVNAGPDLVTALSTSSNVAFTDVALQLGADTILPMARALGLGQRWDLGLPAGSGRLPDEALRDAGELAQLAIGQGRLLVTPLHMAVMTAAIANQGIVPVPYLVDQIRQHSVPVWLARSRGPTGERQAAMPRHVAATITEAMVRVVDEGTGGGAALPGIRVAGKTGTAQAHGGPAHAWFVGFAPADRPVAAVAVLVEAGGSGPLVAAPLGGSVLAEALRVQR